MNAGPRHPPRLDLGLHVDLGIGCAAPRGPDRRDPGAQVEPRAGEGELGGASTRGRVEHVIVQSDEAGDERVPRVGQEVRARGNLHVGAHLGDAAVLDRHRDPSEGRRPRPVDERDVPEDEGRDRDPRVAVPDLGRELRPQLGLREGREKQGDACQEEDRPGHRPAPLWRPLGALS